MFSATNDIYIHHTLQAKQRQALFVRPSYAHFLAQRQDMPWMLLIMTSPLLFERLRAPQHLYALAPLASGP